jgi:hypothetical protein
VRAEEKENCMHKEKKIKETINRYESYNNQNG